MEMCVHILNQQLSHFLQKSNLLVFFSSSKTKIFRAIFTEVIDFIEKNDLKLEKLGQM